MLIASILLISISLRHLFFSFLNNNNNKKLQMLLYNYILSLPHHGTNVKATFHIVAKIKTINQG